MGLGKLLVDLCGGGAGCGPVVVGDGHVAEHSCRSRGGPLQ